MVDGEECAKRVAMGFGVGAALGSSIGESSSMQQTARCNVRSLSGRAALRVTTSCCMAQVLFMEHTELSNTG